MQAAVRKASPTCSKCSCRGTLSNVCRQRDPALLLGRDILLRWLQETGECQPRNSQSLPACPKRCPGIFFWSISLQACSEVGWTAWCGKAFIICSLFWHLFRTISKFGSDPVHLVKCIILILLICKNLSHSFKEKVLVMVLHCWFSSHYSIPEHNSFIFILVVIHTVKENFFPPFLSFVSWFSQMSCQTIQNCQHSTFFKVPLESQIRCKDRNDLKVLLS